ncbi:MAG: LptF/LptG family permease [Abditibacteriales bacterium]|nr:LptF/LptG family permease [Abditibacteriales bacterium]MDW8365783.1 LptF/LptG family permease [Abditibacteriales bacterium]
MKILDRYIAREVIGAWLIGIGWFASIWYALFVLNNITRLATRASMTPAQIVELMLLEVPRSISITVPMALLYGTLMAFARFSHDGEVSAMLTSGVSFYRLMPPVIALGAVGFLTMMALNETVVPATQRRSRDLIARIEGNRVLQEKRWLLLREPADLRLPHERIVTAQGYLRRSDTLIRPQIITFNAGKMKESIEAETARPLKGKQEDWWVFTNVRLYRFLQGGTIQSNAKVHAMSIGKTPLQMRVVARSKSPDEMTWRELRDYLHMMRNTPGIPPRQINELAVQLNDKLALPMSCLVLCLIGPPLALRRQRTTSSVGLGISFLLIVGYFFIWNMTTLFGKTGGLHPVIASWTADVVCGITGVILIWRAGR